MSNNDELTAKRGAVLTESRKRLHDAGFVAPTLLEQIDLAVKARHALVDLYAMVQGEVPSLLRDDHHDEIIRDALQL